MPWKETTKMLEKEDFIREMLKNNKPFKHLCAEFGISEKTGHKWKNRFLTEGKGGLYEQSRATKSHSNALDEDVIIGIIKLKEAHPYWGAKKIRELFARARPELEVPSLSSVNRILDKAQLVKKRHVKTASCDSNRLRRYIKAEAPNDVWAIDFKGWWKSDGELCEPFTVRDVASRKILVARLMESKNSEAVRAVMTELFKKYGLPKVVRSDNGTPFASPNGLLSLTALSAWWITLGIIPDRTDKGTPGQNGSLERMHADMAREIQGRIKGGRAANQIVLDEWVKEYNEVRPNEAIGMKTPDEIYTISERKYIGDFDDIEYPLGFQTRKVTSSGEIIINSTRVSIGFSLRGLTVGLKPVSHDTFEVFLADFLLGSLSTDSYCFLPLN